MRFDIQHYLNEQPEIKSFIRQNPIWYRKLSRDPELIVQLRDEANYFYGRTLAQRVEQAQNHLGIVMMMLEMMRMSQETAEQVTT